MANCSIILGPSGTGKSTSVETLNPKETVIISVLGKRLPFRGSSKDYTVENKNFFHVSDYQSIINYLQNISSHAPHVKNVIIDDATYVMRKEFFSRAKETGYNKFTDLALHFQNVVQACEALRYDLNIFFVFHCEEVFSDNVLIGYQIATVGKLLLSQYNPVECVNTILFTLPKYDEQGRPIYGFYVHKFKQGTVEIPAKSPKGMFEDDFIPNDLGEVVKAMNEYYGI